MNPEIVFDGMYEEPTVVEIEGKTTEVFGRVIIYKSDEMQLPAEATE